MVLIKIYITCIIYIYIYIYIEGGPLPPETLDFGHVIVML